MMCLHLQLKFIATFLYTNGECSLQVVFHLIWRAGKELIDQGPEKPCPKAERRAKSFFFSHDTTPLFIVRVIGQTIYPQGVFATQLFISVPQFLACKPPLRIIRTPC